MKHIILLLSLLSTSAFGVDKVIKAPSGRVIIGSTVNVRATDGTGGTLQLVASDAREQIFNITAAKIVKLPTGTGIKAGEKWVIKIGNTTNISAANSLLTIQPYGASTTIGVVNSVYATFEAVSLVLNPSSVADWLTKFDFTRKEYYGDRVSPGGTYDIGYNNSGEKLAPNGIGWDGGNVRNTAIPYQDILGNWRMVFNANGNGSAGAITSWGFSGAIQLKSLAAGSQACSASVGTCKAVHDGNGYTAFVTSGNSGGYVSWSGDVGLAFRPSWAY